MTPSTQHKHAVAFDSPRIGLFDHMGFGNMGDAAILESFIKNIRKRIPRAEIVAFSLNPQDTATRHKIRTYPIRACDQPHSNTPFSEPQGPGLKARIKDLLRGYPFLHSVVRTLAYPFREIAHLMRSYEVVKSLDAFVLSGGGQLCELWRELPYNVFKFSLLAKLSQTPLYIVGVGAGPLNHLWNRLFAQWSIGFSRFTSLRDTESQALLRSLGVTSELSVWPDPAYGLDLRDYLTAGSADRGRPVVGLNPMGFCDPRIWPRRDQAIYREYLEKLTTFVRWLLAQDFEVEVFTGDIVVDHFAIDDLQECLRAEANGTFTGRLVFRPLLSLGELLTQMSRFDYVVTSKFHGIVFSHLLSRPVIGLSYHSKIDTLMRAAGHLEYCLDVEKFDVQTLKDRFQLLVHSKKGLQTEFRKFVANYASELERNFDHLTWSDGGLVGPLPSYHSGRLPFLAKETR